MSFESLILLILWVGAAIWLLTARKKLFSGISSKVFYGGWFLGALIFALVLWNSFGPSRLPNPLAGPEASVQTYSPKPVDPGEAPVINPINGTPIWDEIKSEHKTELDAFENHRK